jgi:hypothetical protein
MHQWIKHSGILTYGGMRGLKFEISEAQKSKVTTVVDVKVDRWCQTHNSGRKLRGKGPKTQRRSRASIEKRVKGPLIRVERSNTQSGSMTIDWEDTC